MAWVQTNAEAYSGSGAYLGGGMMDNSGMVVNYGSGDASSTGKGAPLPAWVYLAGAAVVVVVAVVWVKRGKR
jgi:hypothetical protein